MKIYNFNISKYFNVGLLLLPGFIYAILALILSSNTLSFTNKEGSLFILNIAQLLSFGVTIAKYAADQMLLAKLSPGEQATLPSFFLKRVFPLSILFCFFLFPMHNLLTVLCLLFCIPIEVFIIVCVIEMNISKKYFKAALLSMIGYPLIFLSFIVASFFFNIEQKTILSIFFVTAFIKFFIAVLLRGKVGNKREILTLSPYVPLQQAGNYVLFKADQLIIASNLIPSLLFNFSIPGDYLFYSKFIEIFSGIATSLSPVLVSYARDNMSSLSLGRLMKNNTYRAVCIAAIVLQVLCTLFLLKKTDALHIYMLIPFILITLFIVPVNILNYELYRNDELKKSNLLNLISFLVGGIFILINLYVKSALFFACIIPLQLITFVMINQFVKSRKNV